MWMKGKVFYFFIVDIIHNSVLLRNYFMPVLIIKSKEVIKIIIRQIHQAEEVRGRYRHVYACIYFARTVHTHARYPRKVERATLLQESSFCKHSFRSCECTIPHTGLRVFTNKEGESHRKHWNELRFAFYPQGCLVSLMRSGLDKKDSCLSVKNRTKRGIP